jgi:hypothetical protein
MSQLRREEYTKMMETHTRKIARLLNKENDVDKYIDNRSSYQLSYFEKLVLCRGLEFSLPRPQTSSDKNEIKASFEKAYWKLDSSLDENQKELATATLQSIALNYIQRRVPRPPSSLLRALSRLRKRDDIIISRPDKGNGVVILDKVEYKELLKRSSVDKIDKFIPVSNERPKTRGRPPKYYHPYLQREKEVTKEIKAILPKDIADRLCPQGSRLAHLYGLPKTNKQPMEMRPILSATDTYNFKLAEWLNQKLKPLINNKYMINDVFKFVEDIKHRQMRESDILVSFDVTALFTNVPVDETINYIVKKAFADNWFNDVYNLNLSEDQLVKLLEIATKDQLFQFDGQLFKQVDGVAMGSPLGPLMANAMMCLIEEKLENEGKMPEN